MQTCCQFARHRGPQADQLWVQRELFNIVLVRRGELRHFNAADFLGRVARWLYPEGPQGEPHMHLVPLKLHLKL